VDNSNSIIEAIMRETRAMLILRTVKPLGALALLSGWLLLTAPAFAEIEMVTAPSDRGLAYHWWPKLVIPAGWQHDRNFSFYYSVNAIAPEGVSFEDARTVMYAKVVYKPREPQIKSLEMFIDSDQKTVRAKAPGLEIKESAPLPTADGKRVRSFTFFPTTEGNWEHVAYGEEGDFYVIFTVSARSHEDYQAAKPAFERLIGDYREKPAAQ
jgi:hypothetical protein